MGTTLFLSVYLWLSFCCTVHQVDYPFAAAVMQIESGIPGALPFRLGHIGERYWGPFCIDDDYRRGKWCWPVDDWRVNVWYGVQALKGKDHLHILHRYNPKATRAYLKAVRQLTLQNTRLAKKP